MEQSNVSEDIVSQNDMNIIQAWILGLGEKRKILKKKLLVLGTVRFFRAAAKNLKIQNLKIVDLKRIM
jgi:hypothetical protein